MILVELANATEVQWTANYCSNITANLEMIAQKLKLYKCLHYKVAYSKSWCGFVQHFMALVQNLLFIIFLILSHLCVLCAWLYDIEIFSRAASQNGSNGGSNMKFNSYRF